MSLLTNEQFVSGLFVKKLGFYALVLVFYSLPLWTDFGNFYHGGTVLEWVILQALAVVILASARRLFFLVGKVEKGMVVLVSLLPLYGVGYGLISAVCRMLGIELLG